MSAIRSLFISNPAAARTGQAAVGSVLLALRSGGWEVEVAETEGPGDARKLAVQAVKDGHQVVTVFGGDGTTMQAAAALVGTGVSLGVIPGGTGNLLAGNLRIPAAPVEAARALLKARPRRLDLGRMERADGTHYFAVACGAGYDARVMSQTPPEQKRRWGMAAYVATTLRLVAHMKDSRHRITVDGVGFDTDAVMVLVANCGEVFPPYVKLGAGISPEDGLLDLLVVRANNLAQGVRAAWQILRGYRGAGGDLGAITYARGREVRVETDQVQPVQLDGEPGGLTPFTATIVPGAIQVLVPPP
ncbi:MAG: diacylglycerol/lipid kinase family protein [Gemmatimonadales bacterium]